MTQKQTMQQESSVYLGQAGKGQNWDWYRHRGTNERRSCRGGDGRGEPGQGNEEIALQEGVAASEMTGESVIWHENRTAEKTDQGSAEYVTANASCFLDV